MPVLTKDIAYEALLDFFNDKPFTLFGTGTSCAIDLDFGMGALLTHLENTIKPSDAKQQQQWQSVLKQLNQGVDFEKAMDQINDEALTANIIKETANIVQTTNKKHEYSILSGKTSWTAGKLIKRIFDARRPAESIHIATPNYDLLA